MYKTTLRLQDTPAKRARAYADRIGAPTMNAALCALIAKGLDAVEREEHTTVPATPRQRGAR